MGLAVLLLFIIIGVFFYFIQRPALQNYLKNNATNYLTERLGTPVRVGSIAIDFFNNALLNQIYIEDKSHDTLIYIGSMKAHISMFSLWNNQVHIENITFDTVKGTMKLNDEGTTNYQYILDAFKTKKNPKISSDFNWDLQLKKLTINSLDFVYQNQQSPYDMISKANQITLDIKEFDINTNCFDINEIALNSLRFYYNNLPTISASNTNTLEKIKDVTTVKKSIKRRIPCDFRIAKCNLIDCRFAYNNFTQPFDSLPYFDPNYIDLTSINATLNTVYNLDDSVFANIAVLNIVDKNDFRIIDSRADLKFAFDEMRFDNLLLNTNRSSIRNAFSMRYNSFSDFSSFNEKIILKGNFEKSNLYLADIAYFSSQLLTTKYINTMLEEKINFDGALSGTLGRLKLKNTEIKIGANTYIKTDISLNGLPNINETFIECKANEITTSAIALAKILPGLDLPEQIYKLGLLNFTGKFTGFVKDFVADGFLKSSLGNIKSNINIKFNDNYSKAKYKGRLSVEQLQLGILMNKEQLLGLATFSVSLDGSGLTLDELNTNISGRLNSIRFKSQVYENIEMNGLLSNKIFEGKLNTNSAHLQLNFEGKIDFKYSQPIYSFDANVVQADLQKMGVVNYPFLLSSKISLNMKGRHIDSLLGNAVFNDIEVDIKNKKYELKQLAFSSQVNAGERLISFQSNLFDAHFKGFFTPSDLAAAVNDEWISHFPSQSFYDTRAKMQHQITYTIKINDSKKLTDLYFPELTGIKNADIVGSFSTITHTFNFNGILPQFKYKNYLFDSLNLKAYTQNDSIIVLGSLSKFHLNETTVVPTINLQSIIQQDSTQIALQAGNTTDSTKLDLKAVAYPSYEKIDIIIRPSNVFINNQLWVSNQDNRLSIVGKKFEFMNFKLLKNNASFTLNSTGDDRESIVTQLSNIDIKDIMSLTGGNKNQLQGIINGTINFNNYSKNLSIETNVVVPNFIIGYDTLGLIEADIKQIEKNNFKIDVQLKGENKAIVRGFYNANKEEPIELVAEIIKVKTKNLERFVKGIFKDLEGIIASDKINITGNINDVKVKGNMLVRQGGLTVSYLKTHYTFDRLDVAFNNKNIEIKPTILFDEYKNTALLEGVISHTNFNSIYFNMNANTEHFHFLNTTKKDNSLFYGQAMAAGNVKISGPINALAFTIAASSHKGTAINIPIGNESEVKKENFIRFITTKNKNLIKEYNSDLNGITLKFNLEITPDATMRIILDETAGDIIEANGSGDMILDINTLGNFAMFGDYEIAKGDYMFTLQNVINKRFEIDKGSKISWKGSPYNAVIDVNAIYPLRASVTELKKAALNEVGNTNERLPINLILSLSGSLFSPMVDLNYEFPDLANNTQLLEFESVNNAIKRDKNELNRQVMGLLITNSFLPLDAAAGVGGNTFTSAGLSNTASEFFSNQISKYVSDFISQYVTNLDLQFGYRNYSESTTDRGNQLSLALKKRFFKDRVEVNLGGNFDISNSTDSLTQLAGDFSIIYALTQNGKVKVRAFRRTDNDIFVERNLTKNGVGLFYREEFDSLDDLISKINQRKKVRKVKKNLLQSSVILQNQSLHLSNFLYRWRGCIS